MSVLAVTLSVILGLLLIPLVLPVSFQGKVQVKNAFRGYGEVSGLGGWIRLYVAKEPGAETRRYLRLFCWEKNLAAGKAKTESKKQKPGAGRFLDVLNLELMNAVYRCLIRLVPCFHLEARLDGEYGTGDPALTGMLSGVIAALAVEQPRVRLNPNFMEAYLDIEGEVKGRFFPIVVIWYTVALLLSSPVRSLWRPKFNIKKFRVREVVKGV